MAGVIQGAVGDQFGGAGANPIVRQGYTGELSVGDRHARYMEATSSGCRIHCGLRCCRFGGCIVYRCGAFVLLNPAGSGVNLVIWNVAT